MDNDLTVIVHRNAPFSFGFKPSIFIKKVLALKGVSLGVYEFTFVSNARLSKLHDHFLDDPSITDIITFDLSDEFGVHVDIYISSDQAKTQSEMMGHSLAFELKTLIVHGILHILGYADLNKKDKAIMFEEQDRILRLLNEAS